MQFLGRTAGAGAGPTSTSGTSGTSGTSAGEEITLMEIVVPAGADLATKADVAGLRAWFSTVLLTVALAQTALTVSLLVALQG